MTAFFSLLDKNQSFNCVFPLSWLYVVSYVQVKPPCECTVYCARYVSRKCYPYLFLRPQTKFNNTYMSYKAKDTLTGL